MKKRPGAPSCFIDMMYVFSGKKLASELLLNKPTVLTDMPSVPFYLPIPGCSTVNSLPSGTDVPAIA